MAEVVEPEDAATGPERIVLDAHAVVRALDLARFGLTTAPRVNPPTAITAITTTTAESRRESQSVRQTPSVTSTAPMMLMIVRVGVVATSTNPVTKVPTSAPAVEMPLSRPTTPPVLARSWSWSFTTMGVTALSTTAGRKNAENASMTADPPPPSAESPRYRMIGTVENARTPPRAITGPRSRWGSIRSASRPPPHAPTAIPASTVPMIDV